MIGIDKCDNHWNYHWDSDGIIIGKWKFFMVVQYICFFLSFYRDNHGIIIEPICSMYGIFTYIWVTFRANVGKYTIHGAYGEYCWIYPVVS